MADKTLKSITFPGLPDRYVVPDYSADIEQVKEDLTVEVKGAIDVTFDASSDGKYIGADGTIGDSSTFHYTDLLPVKSLSEYISSFKFSSSVESTFRIHGYTNNGTWVKQLAFIKTTTSGALKFTTTEPVAYIRISINKTATDLNLTGIVGSKSIKNYVTELNDSVKNALLDCFKKVAWIDDSGQSCYNTLKAAFEGTPITPVPIYSLSNYDFNNYPPTSDGNIKTGISLFLLEKGWTIACDLTTTTAQQGAWRLFSSMETISPYRGFYYGSHGNTSQTMIANTAFKWESTTRSTGSTTAVTDEDALELTDFGTNYVGRHKCVFVYNPQTGFKAFFKDNDGDAKSFSTSEVHSEFSTQALIIGGAGTQYGFVGHFNTLDVWDYPLTDSDVTDFMARD